MGKATSTRQLTQNKKKKQRNAEKWLKEGNRKKGWLRTMHSRSIIPRRLPTRRCSGRAPCPGSTCFRCCDDQLWLMGGTDGGSLAIPSVEDGWVH